MAFQCVECHRETTGDKLITILTLASSKRLCPFCYKEGKRCEVVDKEFLPSIVEHIPYHILVDLANWLNEGGNVDYIRKHIEKDSLTQIHLFGGGMQIRNFLRQYPNELDMSSIWLDDNWIKIIKRTFKEVIDV